MILNISHAGKVIAIDTADASSLLDVNEQLQSELGIDISQQKLLYKGKIITELPSEIHDGDKEKQAPVKILLLGTPSDKVAAVDAAVVGHPERRSRSPYAVDLYAKKPRKTGLYQSDPYTFVDIRPLTHYPTGVERARDMLVRLANDPAIKHIMSNHQFSVGLLTEMDPAMHTTSESKTLGRNHNAGQIIELRLRTDRYDGFRYYRGVRDVLCHELTHNVYGEHDANFWKLYRQLANEVREYESTHKGHVVAGDDVAFYRPEEAREIESHVDGHINSGSGHSAGRVLGNHGSEGTGRTPGQAAMQRREDSNNRQ